MHLRKTGPLYDIRQHPTHTLLYGQDPGAACLIFEGWDLWFLGYPDQALKKADEALTLARELGHPFTLAYIVSFAALLRRFRREEQAAQEYAEEVITFCTAQGMPFWLAWGNLIQCSTQTEPSQHEGTIAQVRQVLAAYQAAGGEVSRSYFLALLVESYGRTGKAAEGLSVLGETLKTTETEGERFYQAELYRLKGEITLQRFTVQSSKFKVENSPEPKVQSPESEAEHIL
jgi:predicted ATPase